MNIETFENIIESWMHNCGLLYKTYSYERADDCFTVEIYTSSDPLDGIYVLVDEFNISVKIIQRHTLQIEQFNYIQELISKISILIDEIQNVLDEQKKYEEENPPQIAEILTFKRSDV